jgi:hypothetical protein
MPEGSKKSDDEGPTPFEVFSTAGLPLIFASVDDEELRVLRELADERQKLRWDHGPAFDRYISPVYDRLDNDLQVLARETMSSGIDGDGVGRASKFLLPAGPETSSMILGRFSAGGHDEKSWTELRQVLVLALRLKTWESSVIGTQRFDLVRLRMAQRRIQNFLGMLISYHGDALSKRARQKLCLLMNKWVVDVAASVPFRYSGFDPDTGQCSLTSGGGERDFWASLLRGLFLLLRTFGPAGVQRCRQCGWIYHPAIWLYSQVSGVESCSAWCKRVYHNSKRTKKRSPS